MLEQKRARPTHIALIMDGNGRWAQQQGFPRAHGHAAGVQAVRRIVRAAAEAQISYLTLYAFSKDNWQRPPEEVHAIFDIMEQGLKEYATEWVTQNIRLRILGTPTDLPKGLQILLEDLQTRSEGNSGLQVALALSYSSRHDLVQTVQKLVWQGTQGIIRAEAITLDVLLGCLSTCIFPAPDLLIRTGGEQRLSDFLLLESAYAELYFTETLWPDFEEEAFQKAIQAFSTRERRFGKVSASLGSSSPQM